MESSKCCCSFQDDPRINRTKEIIEKYKDSKGALIPVLHEIQAVFSYLPEEALKLISDGLNISLSEIYGVATFYSHFSLEPKGEHVIRVCLGTACYVKGSQDIIDKLCTLLNTGVGKTTNDGKFTVEATRCLGGCGLAPVMMVDDKVYGRVVSDDLIRIIEDYNS